MVCGLARFGFGAANVNKNKPALSEPFKRRKVITSSNLARAGLPSSATSSIWADSFRVEESLRLRQVLAAEASGGVRQKRHSTQHWQKFPQRSQSLSQSGWVRATNAWCPSGGRCSGVRIAFTLIFWLWRVYLSK